MNISTILTLIILATGNCNLGFGGSDHNHKNEKSEKHKHDQKVGHDDEKNQKYSTQNHDSHAEKDSHGEHEHGGHDDEHGHEASKFGKDKAIEEVKNGGRQFKLGKSAIKTLKLKTIKLDSPVAGAFEVPSSSIVDFQKEIAVYRKTGSWFELVEVSVIRRAKYSTQIKSKKLSKGDEIVNTGVSLLHVAHLEASGQGGQGHVH